MSTAHPDDQKRTIFENPVRIGLQPLLEAGLRVIGLERSLLVFRELAVRPNAEDSHIWLAQYRQRPSEADAAPRPFGFPYAAFILSRAAAHRLGMS